jgi:hypothetical protein
MLNNVGDHEVSSEILKNIQVLRGNCYVGPILIIDNRPTFTKKVFEIFHEYGKNMGI